MDKRKLNKKIRVCRRKRIKWRKSSGLFQAGAPSTLATFSVLNSALKKYPAQTYINKEPTPLPITIPHQAPSCPILKVKAKSAAKTGVKTMVLRRVAIRELMPLPAPWKKDEEKKPRAAVG
jgi:hypothetical protein